MKLHVRAALAGLLSARLARASSRRPRRRRSAPEALRSGHLREPHVHLPQRRSQPQRSLHPGSRPPAVGHHQVRDETQRRRTSKARRSSAFASTCRPGSPPTPRRPAEVLASRSSSKPQRLPGEQRSRHDRNGSRRRTARDPALAAFAERHRLQPRATRRPAARLRHRRRTSRRTDHSPIQPVPRRARRLERRLPRVLRNQQRPQRSRSERDCSRSKRR